MYSVEGWDTVVVNSTFGKGHAPGYAVYSVVNGSFYGSTPEGVDFSSGTTWYEHQAWFQALLNFFYVEKT
jgi:NADPH:quinone reductase-like Zn-dependent oxidoreductase